ncbi:cation:proton antiporter domain-containing protein [Shimia sp. MMG029]|uniref:cation:proton antiporter domain-containing protein n=1 Tax=Shimia sp. MMG029 TaxID=3021978 RepID=UPI0022FE8582|nr:cation:proton antiporter [Shimia sp. MMG029]MDA5557038.1 cation:proton antiporter [Shimia sp. MMG029]
MTGFLMLVTVFLIAGVIAVPLAARLGLGSVLGYLIAGIAISPILQWLSVDIIQIQHFAEFGVVMMLFLVGLELDPKMLWAMRQRLLGLGGMQVGVTTILIAAIAMAFGLQWSVSLAIGMVFALSSTAIVLQTLNEKGLMQSQGGQGSFQVLLFQDIAVIPMLALLPLLALPEVAEHAVQATDSHGAHGGDAHGGHDDHGSMSLVEGRPGWQVGLITLAAVGSIGFIGSVLTRPLFRFVTMANLREVFVATALALVVGIALLMSLVGLSPALGTFLAGVVLANSEYRHELESDIDPFRGLLLGLFFMTVGAAINFGLLADNFVLVVGVTLGVMLLKAGVLYVLARVFKLAGADRWLFTLGLAQAGEFGFVLLSFTVANNVIPQDIAQIALLVVALSMLLTPALFIAYERLILPRLIDAQEQAADDIDHRSKIIVVGYGRFGGIVARMLRQIGEQPVLVDYSAKQLEALRKFDVKVFFGDGTRADLLHAAGIEDAKMLIIAIDGKEQVTHLTEHVSRHHSHVHIVARAYDRPHVYDLYQAGAHDIIRETFDSAVRAGRSAYEALGIHPYQAERLAQKFKKADRKLLVATASVHRPGVAFSENEEFVALAKELNAQMEEELQSASAGFGVEGAEGWTPPPANLAVDNKEEKN